jgi:hypothetical protein
VSVFLPLLVFRLIGSTFDILWKGAADEPPDIHDFSPQALRLLTVVRVSSPVGVLLILLVLIKVLFRFLSGP